MSVSEHDQVPPAVVPAEVFRALFRRHPAGVVVVTLNDPVRSLPVGFTATSVISVSLEPPTVAFAIARTSSAWPALSGVDTAVLNFLGTDAVETSTRFATPGIDRFAGTQWSRLGTGEPVLDVAHSWARLRVRDTHPTGDSHLVIGEVTGAEVDSEPEPLVFHNRTYHRLTTTARIHEVPGFAVRH